MAKDFALSSVGAQTLAELEGRAGVRVQQLLDEIARCRARHPDCFSSHAPNSLACNDPTLKATGILKADEEEKAYKMLQMLAEYRDGKEQRFSLYAAYKAAGVSRGTMQNWRNDYPLFDALMSAVQEEMVDTMRAEAYRRSTIGHDEPVIYQGVDTGLKVKKFSDGLLQFTLMGYDAKFRAKDVNVNMSGSLDQNINIEGLRDKLAARLKARAKSQEESEE
jgi:hypothetical protein